MGNSLLVTVTVGYNIDTCFLSSFTDSDLTLALTGVKKNRDEATIHNSLLVTVAYSGSQLLAITRAFFLHSRIRPRLDMTLTIVETEDEDRFSTFAID